MCYAASDPRLTPEVVCEVAVFTRGLTNHFAAHVTERRKITDATHLVWQNSSRPARHNLTTRLVESQGCHGTTTESEKWPLRP